MSIKVREIQRARGFAGYRKTRVREVNADRTPIAPDVEPVENSATVVPDATPVSDWHVPAEGEL